MIEMLPLLFCLPLALARPQTFTLPLYNTSGAVFTIKQSHSRFLLSAEQNGIAPARPANPFNDATFPDAIFVETLEIGTPPRQINLQMDTGSWQFWTYDTDCAERGESGVPNFYDPKNSVTSTLVDDSSWSAGYGNGAFMKNLSSIYTDTVRFGGVSIAQQAIGRPQEACSTAKTQVTQGLIGLGYGSWPNANPPQNTFFTNLAPTLRTPLFTVSLNYRNPGYYEFGAIDPRKYSGPLRYFPVPSNLPTPNLWGVSVTAIAVGTDSLLVRLHEELPTFIDSGGAFIYLPQAVCDRYYAQSRSAKPAKVDINHNGNPSQVYLYRCDDTLPDLIVGIGDYKATIPGILFQGSKYDDSYCISNLMVSGQGVAIPASAALFGLPFLRTTFTVFRYDPREGPIVGLARKSISGSFSKSS